MTPLATIPRARSLQGRSKVSLREASLIWGSRLATYLVIITITAILLKIAWEGSAAVFTAEFPFVNTEFLLKSPETLHVLTYEGRTWELPESAYRDFLFERGLSPSDVPTVSYPFAGGGIFSAIVGSLVLVVGSMLIAIGLGVSAAIYLSEYAASTPLIRLIRLSILNLAGVPSIVYGLFGMGMFVLFLDFGQSLLAGWFTLAFMVLPIVIITTEEALRSVPQNIRDAALGLGSTRWQTIRSHVLPYSWRGILSASLLGTVRVMAETAPILFTAAFALRDRLPWQVDSLREFLFQGVMALPFHIYYLSAKAAQDNIYTERVQYGTAFVFLALLTGLILFAFRLRVQARRRYPW